MVAEACRSRYGWARDFPRTDGLERHPSREALRDAYLREHPETAPHHCELIWKATVTVGMTKGEVIAAWGLIEEDLSAAVGRLTADDEHAYEWWTNFEVGYEEGYELFFMDGRLQGVRVTLYHELAYELTGDEDREVDKRIAWLTDHFWYFYVDDDGYLRGATIDPYDADWDTLHLHLYTVARVPHYTKDLKAARRAERRVRRDGHWAEYAAGLDPRSAHPAERCRAILELYPEALGVKLTTEGINDERTKRVQGFYPPVPYFKSPAVQAPRPNEFDETLGRLREWVVAEVPPGHYAMWWPDETQPQLSHTAVEKAITQCFGVMRGIEPYVYTALLYHMGLVSARETPVELPEESIVVYLKDDEGSYIVFTASEEKGLRFHFRVGHAGWEHRVFFWYRFSGYAEAWFDAAEASGAPCYELDPSPYDWWLTTSDAIAVAEQEGYEVNVVGAVIIGGS